MSAHPNRNWRKSWRVDPASLTATHESGVRVRAVEFAGGIDVEIDQASMPNAVGLSPNDVIALGRDLGRRCEEGGRLLMEALQCRK